MIFGNSEIRIKSGSKDHELYSGYANSTCFYHEIGNQSPKIDDLFLEPVRETKYVDYELYQVVFENE